MDSCTSGKKNVFSIFTELYNNFHMFLCNDGVCITGNGTSIQPFPFRACLASHAVKTSSAALSSKILWCQDQRHYENVADHTAGLFRHLWNHRVPHPSTVQDDSIPQAQINLRSVWYDREKMCCQSVERHPRKVWVDSEFYDSRYQSQRGNRKAIHSLRGKACPR